jgi:hypothetical protein
LARNYHEPQSRRKVAQTNSASAKRVPFKNQRNSNTSSLYQGKSFTRDASGNRTQINCSKISNGGSQLYDEKGQKLSFQPKINDKSKLMSPRERDQTFEMLHV